MIPERPTEGDFDSQQQGTEGFRPIGQEDPTPTAILLEIADEAKKARQAAEAKEPGQPKLNTGIDKMSDALDKSYTTLQRMAEEARQSGLKKELEDIITAIDPLLNKETQAFILPDNEADLKSQIGYLLAALQILMEKFLSKKRKLEKAWFGKEVKAMEAQILDSFFGRISATRNQLIRSIGSNRHPTQTELQAVRI